MLNWIDALFFGVRRIFGGGVELPERPALNFVGAVCTDNPAANRTDVAFVGTTIRKVSPVVTVDYTASPGELVRVDAVAAITITLPSAVGNAGLEVIVKEVGGHDELIIIAAALGQAVDDCSTREMAAPYTNARLMSDGADWLSV